MRIDTIFLDNFQGWPKGSVLNFKKGFNVVLGDTDSGKSAIVEAINSVLTGDLPENFISWWANETEINIKTTEHTFYRKRGKDTNEIGCDGVVQERIGLGIDKSYFNNLGLTSLSLSNDKKLSLVLLDQLSSLFFISESAPTRAKIINSVCGIDQIDRLMLEIQRDISSSEAKKKDIEERKANNLNLLANTKQNFNWLSSKKDTIINLEKSIKDLLVYIEKLETKKKQLNQSKENISRLNKLATVYKSVVDIKTEDLVSSESLICYVKKLSDYSKKATYYKNSLTALSKRCESYKVFKNLDSLESLSSSLVEYNEKLKQSKSFNSNLTTLKSKLNSKNLELKDLVDEVEKLKKEVSICPFCGKVMEGVHCEQ